MIGIGHRAGLLAAAHRNDCRAWAPSRRCPGRHSMRPSRSTARDRAAAGADLDHLDDGDAHRQARALDEPRGPGDLELARAVLGLPSSIRHSLAVVPPMSNETTLP